MIFVEPWLLAALAGLPILYWLLRVTPPAPRTERFPAIRLLLGLRAREETPARTPLWLLLLRLLAAALVILALSRPIIDAGSALPGSGPVLLVIDNGWTAAPDWSRRIEAANGVLDRAVRQSRPVALLVTAADGAANPPRLVGPVTEREARARLTALTPQPWPSDWFASAAALENWRRDNASVVYISDGVLALGADATRSHAERAHFVAMLGRAGVVTEICCATAMPRALLAPESQADRLVARVTQPPQPVPGEAHVLAQTSDGRTLARVMISVPAGAGEASAVISLPPELRNRLGRLVLEGPATAGAVALLDERWRRRPVGLVAGEQTAPDAAFIGPVYYVRRALDPFAELRLGDTEALLRREMSVLILVDRPLPPGTERDAVAAFVEKGGLLIRFAGPRSGETAEADPLLPVRLIAGDRQLGGALSWGEPAGLAPFPSDSPFVGLPIPAEVKVSRQVLAEPSAALSGRVWAGLADGTPLVTQTTLGAGRIVLFHVTANAEWSNLPLSGLFVDLLRRLVALSAGIGGGGDSRVLAPVEVLDGFGVLSPPRAAATGLAASAFASMPVSSHHPPGLYGPENGRRALNLGSSLRGLEYLPPIPSVRREALGDGSAATELGPWLMTIAVALLVVDLLIALGLRGLLRAPVAAVVTLMLAIGVGWAQTPPPATLTTRLGHILTGDARVDETARAGLLGLSDYVNRRTAAALTRPDGVEPGRSDLSFYPLLYWPITADAPALSASQSAALNEYMGKGGIILIDTRDGGSGVGFAPGTDVALRRLAAGLTIPPLAPLNGEHVLARAFYLLSDFPGRFTGDPVWAQRDQDRANDSVSPVIIGGHDWAAAWAIDGQGRNPHAVLPGGQRQRVLAYRFGVNLVMYALTGNYKGDQVHVPAILQRLGQ